MYDLSKTKVLINDREKSVWVEKKRRSIQMMDTGLDGPMFGLVMDSITCQSRVEIAEGDNS